jgi:glycosyltransferase involved in cell wall biosynthesis
VVGPIVDVLGGFHRYVADLVAKDGFRPEVVFTAPLSLRMLRLAVTAARRYEVPLVMLNMDDWMSEESARMGALRGVWHGLIAREIAAAKPHLAYAYANSQKLADVLDERYGIVHETMNNASADLLAGRLSWSPPPVRAGNVITFAGAMNWHLQGQTLVRVAEAVAELRRDRDVELRIFAPWEFAPLVNAIEVPGAVTYCGFRAARDLADAYLDSDFLVATTTFREDKIHLFRHSLATKLSDYLCAGRPVLSFGHRDWAVHDYVEQNHCGIAGRHSDRSDVKTQIIKALEMSAEARAAMGQNNRRLWERAHDVRVMARSVRAILGIADET